MVENLPSSSADVMESGSLNLPEPSGAQRPVMGIHFYLPTKERSIDVLIEFGVCTKSSICFRGTPHNY
jgi:hypothetical protein